MVTVIDCSCGHVKDCFTYVSAAQLEDLEELEARAAGAPWASLLPQYAASPLVAFS
jgi:hypothetical protein